MSLPVRGAWIEILPVTDAAVAIMSLPVRGAWIEIISGSKSGGENAVAPRAGSVD